MPTLYFSADSDPAVQISRATSILTGWPMETTSKMVQDQDLNGATDLIDSTLVQVVDLSEPSLQDLDDALNAWMQKWGEFPTLIVIDNLTNIFASGSAEDPYSGREALLNELHTMARDTGACVAALHHVNAEHNDGAKPIPLSGVKGQLGRVPELVLTLHKEQPEFGPHKLRVSTVKNRNGPMDASGNTYVELDFIGETMQITDA